MGFLFVALGVVARALLPWLKLLREEKAEWKDWKWFYLRGQLIAVVMVFLAAPALLNDFEMIGSMPWVLAYLAGYGVSAFGRDVDKLRTNGD